VHIDREHRAPVAAAGSSSWPWWLRVAATVLIGIVGVGIWWSGPGREKDPIAVLAEASPRDARTVEARVTGFPWAPAPSMRRNGGSQDPGQMKLVGVAGEVLEKQAADPSPRMQHAAAIAHLVTGHPKEAAQMLDELVLRQPDAKRWSDLAAAQYTVFAQTDDPAALTKGLAAADSALALDPRFPEALFNRALILEKLNATPQQTREAWEKYLEVDSTSEWASEARGRLKDLAPAGLSFKDELETRYASLDPAAARELASRFPQEARVWGQAEILRRWADAVIENDSAKAAHHLAVARAFGEQLARTNGDTFLLDAVNAVERVPPTQRAILANAHVQFREASPRYRAGDYDQAGAMFASAARGFEIAGSPLSRAARNLHANTIYDSGDVDQAHRQLLALLADAPPTYAGYRAELQWQLGLTFAARGQWGESIQSLCNGIETFERLGEVYNANNLREILAHACDRIGDPQRAWRERFIALRELGRRDTIPYRRAIYAAAAHATHVTGDPRVALSLLRLLLDHQRIPGDEQIFIEALLLRASLLARLDEPEGARANLARAREAMTELEENQVEYFRISADAVDAMLAATPEVAVSRFTAVIEFHRPRRAMYLPESYLQRGRAFVKLGRPIDAAADFEAGILELEKQRETLRLDFERAGMFAIAGELFEEAIALALSRGDVAGAFAYAERDRARTLLESIQPPAAQNAAYENVTILEYVTLPSELVIFVADGERLHAERRRISRTAIEKEVSRLKRAVATSDAGALETSLTRLHEILIAPVKASLRPRAPLVIVHDHILGAVPFIALRDQSGRHLLEDHLVIDAPSAAVHARLAAARRPPPSGPLHLLLFSGARTLDGDLGSLTNIDREMSAVRSHYAQSKLLRATDGLDTFIAAAANADVIHFAGHASSDDDVRGAALLTSGGTNGDDRLDVSEIASRPLPRTRVVVLAGCETAGGQERAREGTISTARAFLSTGVPSVIATIWPIDDRAAADFFPRVHRHLARGLPAAEALRSAQLECIREKTTPFLWAAVQVIGS
ncbi:MAG TPA: CHAT domain-containing protein, partial [Thermoanaerobaculia bacterium]|nr:CHAT domain-containing protein [Thermoanaerobaculia bacterium]